MRNYACDTTAAPLLRAFTQAFSHKRYFATSIATFESKIAGRITAPFKQLVLICVCCDMRSICLDLQKTTFRCVFRSTANCATLMGHLPPCPSYLLKVFSTLVKSGYYPPYACTGLGDQPTKVHPASLSCSKTVTRVLAARCLTWNKNRSGKHGSDKSINPVSQTRTSPPP